MSREQRKKLIEAIEQKRKSKVITYITSDRPNLQQQINEDVVPVLHQHILEIDPSQRTNLDLFLYSRGGDSNVPWTIVSMFREYCNEGKFDVLIPYKAHSAATVISLGADSIVMTKKAELGPIDITYAGPYDLTKENQRLPINVEDVNGYFSLLERIGCSSAEEKLSAFEKIVTYVHPLSLGHVSRALEQTELVAKRLLNTRAEPFSGAENDNIVSQLSAKIFSHSHAISRSEAISILNMKQVVFAEDESEDIEDELWRLYEAYNDYFDLQEAFDPQSYLISNSLKEHIWGKMPLAIVESGNRVDTLNVDVRVRSIPQLPPDLKINLSNFSMSPINLGNLPPGVTSEQLQAFVEQVVRNSLQQTLNIAVEQSVEKLLEKLPTGGFERTDYNRKWNTDSGGNNE